MAGCSRRELLKGLGMLAVLEACGGDDSQAQSGVATSCGSQQCLDLTQPANAPLQTPNGSVLIQGTNGDTIIVIRASPTSVVALSALCTHAGCTVGFDAATQQLPCPCHGSVFGTNGQVINGPARSPLTRYPATLSGNQVTIG